MDNDRAQRNDHLRVPARHEGKRDVCQDLAQGKVMGVVAQVVLMRVGMGARGLLFHEELLVAVIGMRFAGVPLAVGMAMHDAGVRARQ